MSSKNNSNNSEIVKILVFGSTNVGKTSMINLLTDQNEKVGNGQLHGCTFAAKDIHCLKDGKSFIFTDTVGLNEAKNGARVEPAKAILSLMELVKKSKDGFNLVIYVRKAEALQTLDDKNYSLIIDELLQKRVRSLCVNTNAEQYCDGENLNQWWEENQKQFKERNLDFNFGVSGCCTISSKNSKLDILYKEYSNKTKNLIWEAIDKTKSDKPIALQGGIYAILVRVWNSMCRLMDSIPLLSKLYAPEKIVNKNLKQYLIDLGLPENEAENIAAECAELRN